MADWTDLDWAFSLPETITDPNLRAGFEVLVARLRRETEHLPIPTLAQLQIERTASMYCQIRQFEALPMGDPQGFAHPSQAKDLNNFWLGLVRELNETLFRYKADARAAALVEIRDTISGILRECIPDSQQRVQVLARLADAFAGPSGS